MQVGVQRHGLVESLSFLLFQVKCDSIFISAKIVREESKELKNGKPEEQ